MGAEELRPLRLGVPVLLGSLVLSARGPRSSGLCSIGQCSAAGRTQAKLLGDTLEQQPQPCPSWARVLKVSSRQPCWPFTWHGIRNMATKRVQVAGGRDIGTLMDGGMQHIPCMTLGGKIWRRARTCLQQDALCAGAHHQEGAQADACNPRRLHLGPVALTPRFNASGAVTTTSGQASLRPTAKPVQYWNPRLAWPKRRPNLSCCVSCDCCRCSETQSTQTNGHSTAERRLLCQCKVHAQKGCWEWAKRASWHYS